MAVVSLATKLSVSACGYGLLLANETEPANVA